jgi:uncharacterized protein YjlB
LGLENWITRRKANRLENLASLTIPKTDPIFGENGLLIDLWK